MSKVARYYQKLFCDSMPRHSAAAVASAKAHMSNWLKMHPELAKLKPDEHGMNTCLLYLSLEMFREGGPRDHIVERIYQRYSNLRREQETAVLWQYAELRKKVTAESQAHAHAA